MKVVEAGYNIISGYENPLQKVERIARICYKSEEKITEDSYVEMIQNLCKRKHFAMLEHASIALECDEDFFADIDMKIDRMCKLNGFNSFLRLSIWPEVEREDRYFISGNLRAWLEFGCACNNLLKGGINKGLYDIVMKPEYRAAFGMMATGSVYEKGHCKMLSEEELTQLPLPVRFIHQDLSVHFVTDRGVSHEIVRMRPCSFAQESTRFCNYGLGKFGKEITVLKPLFWKEGSAEYTIWYDSCLAAEQHYFRLLSLKAAPQQARSVLPTSLKTEIVVTANLQEWHHIFNLRACDATGPAHPQMKQVTVPLLDELKHWDKYTEVFADLDPHKVIES